MVYAGNFPVIYLEAVMHAAKPLCALALCLALPTLAAGQGTIEDINWVQGPVTGKLGTEAEVRVPEGCVFAGTDGVRKFLTLTENPVGGNERGVILCQNGDQDPWFVIFSFDASGYVRDDERNELDAAAILTSIKRGTEAANRERRKRGWGTLSVEGWLTKPHYDQGTHNLTWAMTAADDAGERSVNHSVRLLGRGGVMHVDLVSSPNQLLDLMPAFSTMVEGFTYLPGHRYAEWRQGDRVAAYGLTALVAGGAGVALAKSGLLTKFWKLIAAGLVALLGALKALWGKITGRNTATQ